MKNEFSLEIRDAVEMVIFEVTIVVQISVKKH